MSEHRFGDVTAGGPQARPAEGTRRSVLISAAALAGAPLAARAAVTPVPSDGPLPDLHGAWRRMFARPDDQVFVWWMSGVMAAHVDGLREFPIAQSHSVMVCRASVAGRDETAVDWRVFGYFADLDTGLPLERWHNVFTGRTEPVPARFERGPGRYVARASPEGATLVLTEADTRVVRTVLTGVLAEGRALVDQSESRIQGFWGLDGRPPPVTSGDVTEVQTRLSLIAPAADVAKGAGPLPGRGYFSQVPDALPAWLGFGDRLGGAPVKGSMRKAAADEPVDPAAWTELLRLHPAAFAAGRLRLA